MRRQTSVPSMSGSPRSSTTRSGACSATSPSAAARCRPPHVIAARAQQRPDRPLDRRSRRRRAGSRGVMSWRVDLWPAAGTTMVNWAPPSGQFSPRCGPARARAARGRSRAPCRCPSPRGLARGAAIETFEQVRQVRRRDARAVIAHPDERPSAVTPARDLDRRCRGGVLRGVLEQVRERGRGQPGIESHRMSGSIDDVDRVVTSVCSTCSRAAATISEGWAQRIRWHRAGVDPRHLEDVLEQARQPLGFCEDQIALLAPLARRQAPAPEVAGGDANRRQRRAQVVRQRGEERRLQLLARAGQLAAFRSSRSCARSMAMRNDAGQRVERAGLDRPPGRRQQADRLRADRSGTSRTCRPPR